jgi:hypothetical protein
VAEIGRPEKILTPQVDIFLTRTGTVSESKTRCVSTGKEEGSAKSDIDMLEIFPYGNITILHQSPRPETFVVSASSCQGSGISKIDLSQLLDVFELKIWRSSEENLVQCRLDKA